MIENRTWIHFLGICGRGAAGIARVMKKKGYYVTGSDQGVYPPMSDYLDQEDISYYKEYKSDHINKDIDLVVIGGNTLHIDPYNVEVTKAKELGIKIIAWPELLAEHVMKKESVMVAGTYGKTTISALLVHMLQEANFDPSYMIGESVVGLDHNCEIGNSEYSVVEGDEHPTLGYSKLPKFAYFPPKYLVIMSAMWDHANIYPTENDFVGAFENLVKGLPEDGFIVADKEGANLEKLISKSKCKVYWLDNDKYKVVIDKSDNDQFGMKIRLNLEDNLIEAESRLFGSHNARNILAASLAAWKLGAPLGAIKRAVEGFGGIKGRLELKFHSNLGSVYHDVGQHPGKAKGAVDALRWRFPDRKIIVVLDPQASVLHDSASLNWYDNAFNSADEVMVTQIAHRDTHGKDRVTGGLIVRAIMKTQPNVNYFPEDESFIDSLKDKTKDNPVILVLSSGGFRGLWNRLYDVLKD